MLGCDGADQPRAFTGLVPADRLPKVGGDERAHDRTCADAARALGPLLVWGRGPPVNGSGASKRSMSELGVRRDKAALSSGCEPHPATAPAGSNRSSHGGNEVAEAFD